MKVLSVMAALALVGSVGAAAEPKGEPEVPLITPSERAMLVKVQAAYDACVEAVGALRQAGYEPIFYSEPFASDGCYYPARVGAHRHVHLDEPQP